MPRWNSPRRAGVRQLCGRDPDNSTYERLIAAAPNDVAPEPLTHDDTATILYTSGTISIPRVRIITHGMRFWQSINLTGPERRPPTACAS